MPPMIFVNLPVRDLEKSKAFFSAIGFSFNPQFTDKTAACMVISETIYAMLLTHSKFQGFAPHPVADASKATEVLVCLTCESRARVDELVEKAVAAGGRTYNQPQDHGMMYGRSFQDLDSHVWELFWMDPSVVKKA